MKLTLKPLTRLSWLMVGAMMLVGCALSSIKPGMTRDEVIARLGRPTRVVPLSAGTRLQYSGQPAGQWANMVDLDTNGHVLRARQVLNANDFARIEVGKWTRQDVEHEFGPPAYIDHVASWTSDIMNYRWLEIDDMLYWVYLDPNNVVQRTGQGMEHRRDLLHDR